MKRSACSPFGDVSSIFEQIRAGRHSDQAASTLG